MTHREFTRQKTSSGEYMVQVAERTLKEVDAIMWLVEPTTFYRSRGTSYSGAGWDQGIGVPVIFISIKLIAVIKRRKFSRLLTHTGKSVILREIIPCSALRGQNTEDIINCIFKYLPYGPMFYDKNTITDRLRDRLWQKSLREKALHALDAEIPHGIAVAVDRMKERPGKGKLIDIDATIICEKDSIRELLLENRGLCLKKLAARKI